ncbi:purple acid phosphatase family protein [Pseudohaliea rubra]|uniref:Uncharacterized protein n=1 Tax=Pseudohaliea rubra DSM 19751 TaxID=1265313 RepID=A0A095VRF3_9GAMM|nr:metallophosphoesterase family protein [Pseudohaliea rubra]KGE04032.1 hypothetical protein HRUBRA_01373 [Pseudohaliea rubra DSM 19751]
MQTSLIRAAVTGILLATLGVAAVSAETQSPHVELERAVSGVIERMQQTLSVEERLTLTPESAASFLNGRERQLFSTGFARLQVSTPVTVHVAFESAPGEVPFWLPARGFERRSDLDFLVKGEDDYATWSKRFPAGEIGLGIPGFTGEMKPYLIFIEADNSASVEVEPLVPGVDVVEATLGQQVYLDDDDDLTTLPDRLLGLPMLRSYESWEFVARLVGYFRVTDYPSSERPDHVQLTWQGDPASSVTVQWRTRGESAGGRLWLARRSELLQEDNPGSARIVQAEPFVMTTLQIENDPAVTLHRATLDDLAPATDYAYAVSAGDGGQWSELRSFRTAAKPGDEPYSFVYLGDPQSGLDRWGELIRQSDYRFPESRFYLIAGDLIDEGTQRDNWDQFFAESSPVFDRRPVLPAIGNHDSHGGHPTLYLQQFALPDNGTDTLDPGRTYHVTYQDMLVVVMDSNYDLIDPATQTEWLDRVLGESDARWKTVIYHHPLYASHPERDNAPLRDAWLPIFDRHGVDIAFQGHDHAYMRTQPLRGGKPVAEGEHGTVYLVAVSGTKMYEQSLPEFAVFGATDTRTFQVIDVDPGNGTLRYRAISEAGEVIDEFALQKP